nr:MAG TPA: hypothetical protein [Caudoviricetes sp.]
MLAFAMQETVPPSNCLEIFSLRIKGFLENLQT